MATVGVKWLKLRLGDDVDERLAFNGDDNGYHHAFTGIDITI